MTANLRAGWKIYTHDRRPPMQGGDPAWDGTYPTTLPVVALDTSDTECAPGYHYCATLAEALALVGFWPDGRPALAVAVEASTDAIERGGKRRASSLTLLRVATETEVADAIGTLSARWFGEHAERMAEEQFAWYRTLGRPGRDAGAVEEGLRAALAARGLSWSLRRYESVQAAWGAWAAWGARATWDAWAAWDARDARATREARAAWGARDARDAWDARDALTVCYAAFQGWVDQPADLLTVGLRDAYAAGLGIALPTAVGELGWAMEEEKEATDGSA